MPTECVCIFKTPQNVGPLHLCDKLAFNAISKPTDITLYIMTHFVMYFYCSSELEAGAFSLVCTTEFLIETKMAVPMRNYCQHFYSHLLPVNGNFLLLHKKKGQHSQKTMQQ